MSELSALDALMTVPEYMNDFDPTPLHFNKYFLSRARVVQGATWSCDASFADVPYMFLHKASDGTSAYVETDEFAARINLSHGTVSAHVAANTEAHADDALALIREWLPPAMRTISNRIPIWLWTMTPQGPHSVRRKIDVPFWDDIRGNYAQKTEEEVSALVQRETGKNGIILWNGVPGTGKTYALRALAAQWQSWCDIHYIVDPEIMFGTEPSYLLKVVLEDDDGKPDEREDRWKLLVLEDTGEMLTMDAKQNVGQALSRLLNVTDGLLGQGMRIMVMVTTNEELGTLNSAVLRPGRCLARTSFDALSQYEARTWLRRHGSEREPERSATLADLYATLAGYAAPRERRAGLIA